MEALWTRGPCSVREIQESFPAKKRPAYTTVQTMVYRLEVKKALRRVKKIATANIFEAAVSREAAERRLIDDLLGLFGGRSRPIMAHLIESGTLTLEDVREAEKTLLKLAGGRRTNRNEPGYLSPFADHLWQSTLFAGVAGLLTLALRRNHARVRHGLWLAASCKFLIPFSVLIALGRSDPWRTATGDNCRRTYPL